MMANISLILIIYIEVKKLRTPPEVFNGHQNFSERAK